MILTEFAAIYINILLSLELTSVEVIGDNIILSRYRTNVISTYLCIRMIQYGEWCWNLQLIARFSGEAKIIRECENQLMKSAYHRLRMPVLRRHGYCEPSRKNDFWNPTQTTDSNIEYCFCNDWNGCNSAPQIFSKVTPILSLCMLMVYFAKRITA